MRDHRVEKDTFYKDRSQLRETNSAEEQARSKRASLKDYSLKHRVEIQYDMNEDSVRDRMFILHFDNQTAILDYEELLKVSRFI